MKKTLYIYCFKQTILCMCILILFNSYGQSNEIINKIEIGDTITFNWLDDNNFIEFSEGKYYILHSEQSLKEIKASGGFTYSISFLNEAMNVMQSKPIISAQIDSCKGCTNNIKKVLLWNENILVFSESIIPQDLRNDESKKNKIQLHKLYCQLIDKSSLEKGSTFLLYQFNSEYTDPDNRYVFTISPDSSKLGIICYENERSNLLVYDQKITNRISNNLYQGNILPEYCKQEALNSSCSDFHISISDYLSLVTGFSIDNTGNAYITSVNTIENTKNDKGAFIHLPRTTDSSEYRQIFFSQTKKIFQERIHKYSDQNITYWNVNPSKGNSSGWIFAGLQGIDQITIDQSNGEFIINSKPFPSDLYDRIYAVSSHHNDDKEKIKPEFRIRNCFIKSDNGFFIIGELVNRKYFRGNRDNSPEWLFYIQDIIIIDCTNDLDILSIKTISRTRIEYNSRKNETLIKFRKTLFERSNTDVLYTCAIENEYYILFNDSIPVIYKIDDGIIYKDTLLSLTQNRNEKFYPDLTLVSSKKALTTFSQINKNSLLNTFKLQLRLTKLFLK